MGGEEKGGWRRGECQEERREGGRGDIGRRREGCVEDGRVCGGEKGVRKRDWWAEERRVCGGGIGRWRRVCTHALLSSARISFKLPFLIRTRTLCSAHRSLLHPPSSLWPPLLVPPRPILLRSPIPALHTLLSYAHRSLLSPLFPPRSTLPSSARPSPISLPLYRPLLQPMRLSPLLSPYPILLSSDHLALLSATLLSRHLPPPPLDHSSPFSRRTVPRYKTSRPSACVSRWWKPWVLFAGPLSSF